MNDEKCYMCDRKATSTEHVPPKCLFPEEKDTKGFNFRKELITVPSCELHNSSKSKDDEFLMLSLSGLIKNNPVGSFHHLTKANRALTRKNESFIQQHILRNHKYVKIRSRDGKFRTVAFGNPDLPRLENCFEHIAYGLYYHEFKEPFKGEIKIFMGFLEYQDKNIHTLKELIKKRFNIVEELKTEYKGMNPRVFYYQFHKPDIYKIVALKLVFYDAAEVYMAFKSAGISEPFDLGLKLMSSGIHSIFKLGDEEFEFNK